MGRKPGSENEASDGSDDSDESVAGVSASLRITVAQCAGGAGTGMAIDSSAADNEWASSPPPLLLADLPADLSMSPHPLTDDGVDGGEMLP